MSTVAIVAVGVIVAVLIAGGAIGGSYFVITRSHATRHTGGTAHPSPSPTMQAPVTANSVVLADGGRVVFTDNFKDSGSGWKNGTLPSGTTLGYSSAGYVVVGKGALHHFAFAPYELGLTQASVSMTATQTSGAPAGAGFGVLCQSGSGSNEIDYEFLVLAPGNWFTERRVGATSAPVILRRGSSPAAPGDTPITVEGMCATLQDGVTTRLVLFINGKLIADLSDKPSATVNSWRTGMTFASRTEGPATVTATRFELRDLSG